MKIGIVGSGMVGSTSAYAMIMSGIGREIVLVDKNEKRVSAEVADLNHAVPFSNPLTVRAGGYPDLKGAKLVVISAGVSQKPGESRLDLLKRNAAVFREIVPSILRHAPDTLLVVATNPVDIMTHLAARYAAEHDIPSHRVLGTGTTLDTARFRFLLGDRLGVDPPHVHAYVVGEHGDSEVLAWSLIRVGAMELDAFCDRQDICLTDDDRAEIDDATRNAAAQIIDGKGATYYGIGSAVAKIADVILHDQRSVLTVTTPTDTVEGVADVTVSMPHLVGGDGVLADFPLTAMSDDEKEALARSARVVRVAIDEINSPPTPSP
jgi:L-lactate dehydrogenase